MPSYQYLIIGGGMTAAAALEGIREVDPNGSIGLIGAEANPPYNRPPLSKGLWKGEPLEGIWRKLPDPGATLHLGRKVVSLDPATRTVTDDGGGSYRYEKLLLATGATPRRLSFAEAPVIYFRTLEDYKALRELTGQGRRFAVIGGGFIGWEVAGALLMNGQEVVMCFPEAAIGTRLYPADLSRFLNDYYREKGARLLAGRQIVGIERNAGGIRVRTQTGESIDVDGVVAGIGVVPEVALAQAAGLRVDNGIVVDEFLRTSDRSIYAAGDVANFMNLALGHRLRAEHEDNANAMGRAAGRGMAGAAEPYRHLPFFYSDLFDLGYEAVGELNPRLDVVADWKEPNREGVIYYLSEGRVRGVLLWNVWGQVEEARWLIAEGRSWREADLRGRLPQAA